MKEQWPLEECCHQLNRVLQKIIGTFSQGTPCTQVFYLNMDYWSCLPTHTHTHTHITALEGERSEIYMFIYNICNSRKQKWILAFSPQFHGDARKNLCMQHTLGPLHSLSLHTTYSNLVYNAIWFPVLPKECQKWETITFLPVLLSDPCTCRVMFYLSLYSVLF